MSLNKEKGHVAHKVEKYFEIIRLKNLPVLYLLQPDREQNLVKVQQREAIIIKNDLVSGVAQEAR